MKNILNLGAILFLTILSPFAFAGALKVVCSLSHLVFNESDKIIEHNDSDAFMVEAEQIVKQQMRTFEFKAEVKKMTNSCIPNDPKCQEKYLL